MSGGFSGMAGVWETGFQRYGNYSAHFVSRISPLFGSYPVKVRDCRRISRCIRLLKNCRIANLRAFYDPIVTGLSDETQFSPL
jgi:hypothetical protein